MLAVVMTLPYRRAALVMMTKIGPLGSRRGGFLGRPTRSPARSAAGAPVRHQGDEGLALLLGRLDGGGAEGVREAGEDLAHQAVTGPGSDLPRLTPLVAAEGRD